MLLEVTRLKLEFDLCYNYWNGMCMFTHPVNSSCGKDMRLLMLSQTLVLLILM